jgi:hypothetical protein
MKLNTNFKQNLQGYRVTGRFHGITYFGTITESVVEGSDFNHIIILDRPMTISHARLGHPPKYKNYKPMVFTGLNYNTKSPSKFLSVEVL